MSSYFSFNEMDCGEQLTAYKCDARDSKIARQNGALVTVY